ncbi:hypothetical protein GCM10010389_28920 [Streptomyces echinoruber]|uniref:Uncharacterized protein n=1 Tax=Streptomyces echinoruber TaxID=68898 RepID=A0A918R7P7_9ACTN|nr:hypothetical protein GCM10010389_28920 [Streptomyces echinoruber]
MPPSGKAGLVTVIRRVAVGVGTPEPPSPPHPATGTRTAAATAADTSLLRMAAR